MAIKWAAVEEKTILKEHIFGTGVETTIFLAVDVDGRMFLKDYSLSEKSALDYDLECLSRGENPFKDWEPLSMICEMLLEYTDKDAFKKRFFAGEVILPGEPHNIKSRETNILATGEE